MDCLTTLYLQYRLNFHNLMNKEVATSQCNEYVLV